jgi:Concanavalin A-like lectin/glucanases superfamily
VAIKADVSIRLKQDITIRVRQETFSTTNGTVVTLGNDTNNENFAIRKVGNTVTVTMRSSTTTNAGRADVVLPKTTTNSNIPVNVVVTYRNGTLTTYQKAWRDSNIYKNVYAQTGDLSNWGNFPLTVANNGNGTDPWRGQMNHIAVYDRALTDAEASDAIRITRTVFPRSAVNANNMPIVTVK